MILLTGGHGRLGTEIRKLLSVWAPTRKELDITQPIGLLKNVDLIIHAAAYTDVDGAETNREECWNTNVLGTRALARTGIPMIYISTDGVFDGAKGNYTEHDVPNPLNFYSMTKLVGEHEVRRGAIIRCSPRVRPWEREKAYDDRFFSAQYMDEIAAKIVQAVEIGERLPRIVHIGSKRRSHHEMAIETHPDVAPINGDRLSRADGLVVGAGRGAARPLDTSMDCSLWESLVSEVTS